MLAEMIGAAHAADVQINTPLGGNFVVKDTAGANTLLTVGGAGPVTVPNLLTAPTYPTGVCFGSGGVLGQCAPTGGLGAAEFVRTIQTPNNSVPPGTAFTIDTDVFNSVPSEIVASASNGGTVFSLNAAGTYALDYEMSLNGAGSVGVYEGPSAGSLSLDTNTIAGSSTANTWIHGRAFVIVGSGAPVLFEISSVVGTASVGVAGTAPSVFMIRLTIVKIA